MANFSDHLGDGALGISDIKLPAAPKHPSLGLLSVQVLDAVCSHSVFIVTLPEGLPRGLKGREKASPSRHP